MTEPVSTAADAAPAPGKGAVLRNTFWLMMEQGIARIVGLVVGVAVARYLGPADFGAVAFAAVFISLFHWTSQLGFESIAVRALVRDPDNEPAILGSALRVQIIGTAIGALIAVGIAQAAWGLTSRTTTLVAISAMMLSLPLSGVFAYRFKAHVKERPAIMARNLSVLVGAGAKVASILLGFGVYAFAGANALTTMCCLGLVWLAYRQDGGRITAWRYDHQLARTMFRDAWPLALSAIAVGLNMQIDQIMLGVLTTDHDVGIYAAAVKISEACYVIPVAVCASSFPILVRLHAEGSSRYGERLQNLMDWLTWMAVPGAALAGLLSPWIVQIMFGADYAQSAPVLAMHIWSAAFVAQGVVQGQWFIVEGQQRIQSVIHVFAAAANVALNLWLIPIYGPAGAAIATLITYAGIVLAPVLHPRSRATAMSALRAYAWPLRRLLPSSTP